MHYAINPAETHAGDVDKANTAMAAAGRASGIRVIYDGTSSSKAAEGNGQVIITWQTHEEQPWLGQSEAGVGQPFNSIGTWPMPAKGIYGSGIVIFDSGYAASLSLYLHEIGHIFGLGHTTDHSQVMGGSGSGVYGSGDLTGLAHTRCGT
jgi:hypothetical protein